VLLYCHDIVTRISQINDRLACTVRGVVVDLEPRTCVYELAFSVTSAAGSLQEVFEMSDSLSDVLVHVADRIMEEDIIVGCNTGVMLTAAASPIEIC